MMLTFTNPLYLLLLAVLVPLIVFVHFFSLKYVRRKALKFANFEAIEKITGTQVISKNLIILYLRIAIVLFFVLALSGIAIKYTAAITERNFVLAIDSSGSMATPDLEPNRLEAAKQAAIDFVNNLGAESEIGVVSFAGMSFIEQEITKDKARVKDALYNINLKQVGGTDLLNAIITSANLIKTSNKGGAIILLTDGQFNVGNLENILNYTTEKNIPIYAIGVGTKEGGYFIGNVMSKVEEDSLQAISNYSNGKYYLAETKEQLKEAYNEIAVIKQEETTLNISILFFLISLTLILVEWILLNTKYKTLP